MNPLQFFSDPSGLLFLAYVVALLVFLTIGLEVSRIIKSQKDLITSYKDALQLAQRQEAQQNQFIDNQQVWMTTTHKLVQSYLEMVEDYLGDQDPQPVPTPGPETPAEEVLLPHR